MWTRRYGLIGVGSVVVLAASALAVPSLMGPLFRRPDPRANRATAVARRTDLGVTLTTGGLVESSHRTVIECQLENLAVSVKGNGMSAGGSSTILSVIPDGTAVEEGDELCVLDASAYEDLLVTQQMNVDRAKADFRQAELNLDVARMAVGEYRDGLMRQTLKTLEGGVALSESDYQRATDRLEWTRRMLAKGYMPRSQVTSEEFQARQIELGLTKGRTALRMFKAFSAPIYLRILQSEVMSAEAVYTFQKGRLARNEERLAYLRRQVERCTIRAPHKGFVIYANEQMKNVRIEPGMLVRQRQRLFYLPDLTKMEVGAMLHESVVAEVKPGMRARVRLEALSGRELEGHVVSIAQLPTRNMFNDVKYFVGVVKLDTVPVGLRPGMSAEVEIQTARRLDVVAVPPQAVSTEGGREVCYVAHDDGIERREVKIGQATRDLLEVTEGLDEGDEVVLDPTQSAAPGEVLAAEPFSPEAARPEPAKAL